LPLQLAAFWKKARSFFKTICSKIA